MLTVYRVQQNTKLEKVPCANQSHLMQLVDQWGFQRVLHYVGDDGMQCTVYCPATGHFALACQEMCLVVQNFEKQGSTLRLQDVSRFVTQHYAKDAHLCLRLSSQRLNPTPNAGSLQSKDDLDAGATPPRTG